ncbi:Anaphase-promoting complex subunit 1 [Mycoblastus sanguinarius]|nr:Anaphase-promoting complex subunit 1 [Mycoblastus sanguinarius]
MASVASLGVHKPSALPFLVAEGILPAEPAEDTFKWHTIGGHGQGKDVEEEELVTTEHCVVWSRGGVIQRSFRFDVEGEHIVQAAFTHFPQISKTPKTIGVHSKSLQRDPIKETANGKLKVRKHRDSSSKPRSKADEIAASDHDAPSWNRLSASPEGRDPNPGGRALVVVLKTQAHVFFVSGTSHIVHLPFEVDAIFPSVHGILLQRKLPEKDTIPPTPQLPSVPNNSFAFSQQGPSQSSQDSHRLANLSTAQDPDSPILNLLQDVLQRSRQAPSVELPRLYCLADPLAEIGTVAVQEKPNNKTTLNPRKQRSSAFDNFDSKENLLYVSQEDELVAQRGSELSTQRPLVLAVTENQENGTLGVWTVTYVDHGTSRSLQRQDTPTASSTFSRRRSSYGPSIRTGSTTPTARGAASARESFGVARSRIHTNKDPALEESSVQGHGDLLDLAFENPAIPAKSSRRVSSLLARADLSTNQDRTTFSDLAGAHVGNKGGRRGPSFGGHGTRLSVGPDVGATSTKSHTLSGIRSSLDSVSLQEPSFDDMVDDIDDLQDLRSLDDPEMNDALRGLRKEMVFKRIYSMPGECQKLQRASISTSRPDRQIIMMRSPSPSLEDASDDATIVLYLMDRQARELLVLHINVHQQVASKKTQKTHSAPSIAFQGYSARVTGMTRQSSVIDACKIGDGSRSRILVLDNNSGGIGELSLQAPWSCLRNIELPLSLFLHNPYQIANDISLRQRREGGLRRRISRGPQALVALQNGSSQGRVDVVDSDGIKHRLQIQLRPRNPLIRKVIRVAESVLPASEADGEAILRGWWDVMSWLQARPEEETDIEWTAMVVVLFSMGVAFVEDLRTETITRQKKRKGGLLRSSSGANTDLESWEAMLSQEGGSSSTSPTWMRTGAWEWTAKEKILPAGSLSKRSRSSSSVTHSATAAVPVPGKSPYLIYCISIARDFIKSPVGQAANGEHGYLPTASLRDSEMRRTALASILVGLHLLREELKLDVLAAEALHRLTPILAQIGSWLGWETWGFKEPGYYIMESTDMETWLFEDSVITRMRIPPEPFPPPSILHFIETTNLKSRPTPIISLLDVASSPKAGTANRSSEASTRLLLELTPRSMAITNLLMSNTPETAEIRVAKMASSGLSLSLLETLPESVAVVFRAAIMSCQAQPSTKWDSDILKVVGREDIAILERGRRTQRPHGRSLHNSSNDASRDVHSICHSTLEVETVGPYDGSAETDRQAITRLLWKEDQRFAEAAKLVHPLLYPTARCNPEPEWSDTDLLEAQQELVKVIAVRTLSVSPGRSLLFYSARLPLLTEKFPIHGFTLSCVMKPADTTVTADRSTYTEEKTSWAFFHAGVEAGLSISKDAKGIDTSWILFNKPRDLTTRHAGFLLALGLNGHLRSIAKWVAFKYLTPKHTMTSIGLLLGLSASYLGTMDTLITRLLSVHVTRMLPPGAAELNLSPLTQTSGIMGIGLLYCNTQHRRMSEVMLSEMENVDQEDNANPLENFRDEGYRLAAGFALGYINLGRGKDLKGLHDMQITERLLSLAISTRKVSVVHILDKATAAATVATALIFMKTQDEALARKIDIPDTIHQYDYVRPDMFLLRTVARHLIMWDRIQATSRWMKKQLPLVFHPKLTLKDIRLLTSQDMPFFNILAGLCLSIGLRFAGSGSFEVRNVLCHYLDQFMRICRLPTLNYDARLARITVRNCQDVVALAASCVMAGTGDLHIFRRLRSLHGRTDADTPYGSHLAIHFAIGVLFIGGGTHTFGTSDIATASLLCAFYPLFPNTVLDNKSHLQAFRHFWVLAAERRCMVTRDVDMHRPLSLPILVTLRTGTEVALTAPCLLPELETITKIQTNDPEYWAVTLDLADNPNHHEAFKRHQSIYVRRRAAYDAHASVFSATMQALNDEQSAQQLGRQVFKWIFTLPTFAGFDRAEQALVLPADAGSSVYRGTRGTVVDDRLVLEKACVGSGRSERLWNLRILFAWADGLSRREEEGGWLGKEVIDGLRAGLAMRRRKVKGR